MIATILEKITSSNREARQLGLLPIVFGCVAFAIAYQILYTFFLSPLRSVPGPLFARFTRLWELYILHKGHFHRDIVRMHEEQGPVVRIAPNKYSFSEADDLKKIYAFGGKFPKSEFYDPQGNPFRKNIFNVRDMTDHADRRRKYASLYSMSTMVAYEDAVDRMTAVCIRKMQQFLSEERSISLPQFMQYYAFDVIGEISVDDNFGMMEKEGDTGDLIKSVHAGIRYHARVGLIPETHPWLVRIGGLLTSRNPFAFLDEVFAKKIALHSTEEFKRKRNPRAEPFITKLLDMEETKTSPVSSQSIVWERTLVLALIRLDKLAKLREEIDLGQASGQISDPVTFQESQSMPYLQAVIKETLRLHPAVGYILPRIVPQGGVYLAGRHFPEGTEVGVSAWVLHYDRKTFGPDPYTYRPERWLESDGSSKEEKETMFFAFGGGARTCIGKNISLLEMCKVIPQIVRRFDLEFDRPGEQWVEDCAWFVFTEYKCRIRDRR
ncbi:hypothetical protein N7444_004473 [Penicillium canescens]|nr:hypothetical protein N7444_004473 [Penicillium canescens]